ncbi:MAG TPA: ABC transporter substrate-binding protein, partial [Pseudonocardia sp.]
LRIVPVDTGDGSRAAVGEAVRAVLGRSDVHGAVTGFASADVIEMEMFADAGLPYIVAEHSMAFQRRVEAEPSRYAGVWGLMPSYDPYGDAAAERLASLAESALTACERRVFVVSAQGDYETRCADGLASGLARRGWQVVGRAADAGPDTDWSAVVETARDSGADLLASTAYLPAVAAGLTAAFAQSSWECLLFIQYACKYDDYLTGIAGVAADGVLFDIIGGPIEALPVTAAIRERFAEASLVAPDRYAIDVFQATHLYATAARAVGGTRDHAAVGRAIGGCSMDLAEGRLRFDERTHLALHGDDAIPLQWAQLQGGRPVCVSPALLATGDFVTPSWL